MSSSKTIELETGDNLEYKFFPINSNTFEFCVRARNDAHIILTSSASVQDTIYKVIIGGRKNTITFIRKNDTKSKMSEFTPDILSAHEFRKFTVEWKRKQILVHYKGDILIFFYLKDSLGLDKISHVGVATGWGATGSWIITEAERQTSGDQGSHARRDTDESSKKYSWSNAYGLETRDNTHYFYYPNSSGCLNFRVKAKSHVHVLLSSRSFLQYPFYEVIFNENGNSKVVLRQDRSLPNLAEVTGYALVTANNYRGYKIRWLGEKITVGYESDSTPFLSWTKNQYVAIDYVGFHAGNGSSGSWIIKRTPEPGGNGYWVRASNGEVPPLAYIGGFDVETDLYIARAHFQGQLIPGMVREGSKTCSVVLGWEYQVSEYEVLCECRGRWFYTNKTYIPSTAIRAGKDRKGTPIYVGKINRKNGVILGKVHNSICFVSINGKETQHTEFYILVSPEGD